MIKYLLKCVYKHEFESWFSNSIEYDKLKKRNLIECIFCKSTEVEKTIMSPYVVGEKNNRFNNIPEKRKFIKIKKDLKKNTKIC